MRLVSFTNFGNRFYSLKLFNDGIGSFGPLKRGPIGAIILGKRHCVDSVDHDADMTRKYVRFQEKKEKQMEQLILGD